MSTATYTLPAGAEGDGPAKTEPLKVDRTPTRPLRLWRLRRLFGPAAAVGLTLVFGALFVAQGSLGEAGAALAGLSAGAVFVAFLAALVSLGLTGLRWHYLLRAAGVRAPFGRVFAGLAAGSAANNVVPARGGDLLRLKAVREVTPVPAFAVVGTLVAERLLDGLVLALLVLLGALLAGLSGPLILAGLVLSAGALVGVLVAALAAASPERAERLLLQTTRLLPSSAAGKVAAAGLSFVSGLGVFHQRRLLGQAFGVSVLIRIADLVMYLVLAKAFALGLSLGAVMLVEGIGSLALAVPGTAAGVGSFDYLTLVGAKHVGAQGGAVGAYVLAVHALIVLPTVAVGLVALRFALPRTFSRATPCAG